MTPIVPRNIFYKKFSDRFNNDKWPLSLFLTLHPRSLNFHEHQKNILKIRNKKYNSKEQQNIKIKTNNKKRNTQHVKFSPFSLSFFYSFISLSVFLFKVNTIFSFFLFILSLQVLFPFLFFLLFWNQCLSNFPKYNSFLFFFFFTVLSYSSFFFSIQP